MNRHLEIFAKSPQNGGVSLFDHLQQTALAADKIACELGLNSSLIKCGAFLHDIGKTHPVFQEKLNGKKDFTKIDFRHEIASLFFLPLFQRDYWHPLTEMIIAHHRSPVKDIREQGIIDLIEIEGVDDVFERHIESWDNWSTIALEILEALGLKTRKLTRNEALEAFNFAVDHCEQKPLGWSKLKGILISSDYLASALTENTANVLPKLFRVPDLNYFSSDARKSPLYPLSMMNTADKRKHTIVIAPTGAGKTDFLMRRCSKRVFYILPFQASINAMYKRFKSSLPPETDIRLLHAASSVVIKNKNEYEEKVLQPLVGSSVKVLTPHQIASLICGTRGFESIAVDIAGCDVILDEIHCYSDLSQS
ncbi:MAG: CRISPR-associated endonuclease Cas3'', partial [Bacillota bacterium]